ncbi:AAA family ATPase [Mycobacterium syngnathidarum]
MRIKLFDGLSVEVDGKDVAGLLPGRKGRTTIAYLAAHHEEGASRDELVELLWPARRPAAPRANLRTLLSRIRHVLGADALIEGDRLCLADDIEVDLSQAICLIGAAREARARRRAYVAVEAARNAVGILDGAMVRGIDGDWVDRLRGTIDEYRNEMLACIADMGSLVGGDVGNEAIAAARELVERDGYLERSHASLMRALVRGGERAEALRVFEALRHQLDEELGALPGPELQELHQAILREDDLGAEATGHGSAAWTSDRVPLPPEVAATAERVFVGRDQELTRLGDASREHNGGNVIAVTGPPGVGKSLLTSRFAAQCAHSGQLVLFGRCDDGLGVAYQPFVEAIGRLVRGLPAEDVDRFFGRVAHDLARIVPDLDGAHLASSRDEPDTERYRLFEAVADVLRAVAQAAPVVLLLDDIHWSDRPTQQMLRHVVRATRDRDVAILITHRDTPTDHADGFAELLEDLVRDGDLTTVPLAGLDDEAIRTLVDAELGARVPQSVVAAIGARTGGNPLFARELARDLQTHLSSSGTGLSHTDLQSWPVPDGIQHVVRRRCSLLSEVDQELLARAATLGREVCPTDLAATADVAEVAAMSALEKATHAGLMQVRASDSGTFAFTHPVLREAILAAISPPRLGRMHLENAQRLDGLWRHDEVEQQVARLAHHRLAAAEAGLEVGTAIDWLDKAAAQLERTLAYEASATLYARALALLDESPEQRGKRAGLLLRLSAAQWRSGHREDSRHSRHAAFDLASQLDDAELMAQAAIGHERYFEINTFEADESAMAREALAALPDQAMGLRAQVLARLSRIEHWTGDPLRTSAVAEDAVKIAHDCGDEVVLADAYNAVLLAYREPSHPIPRRVDAAAELIATSRRLGSDERRLEGEAHRLISLVEGGRTREIRPAVERFGRIVQGVRQPFWVYYRHAWAATLAFIEGDLKRSEHYAELATQTAMGARSDAAEGGAAGMLQRLVEQGQAPAVADLTAQMAATDGLHPGLWRSGVATVMARAGRVQEASTILRELVNEEGIHLKRDVLWAMSACFLAEASHAIGDRDAARAIAKELEPIPDWIAMAGSGRGFLLVSQRLGQLAQVLGDHTRALAHFDRARRQGKDLSAGLIVAWADLETAATLLDRNGPGDRAQSEQLINTVDQFAQGRGLGLIEQRITTLRGDGHSGLAFAV